MPDIVAVRCVLLSSPYADADGCQPRVEPGGSKQRVHNAIVLLRIQTRNAVFAAALAAIHPAGLAAGLVTERILRLALADETSKYASQPVSRSRSQS